LGSKGSSSKDFFNFADSLVKYIYNGAEKPATKEDKLALARHIAGGGKLELREGQTGLLEDEEIADEDIPGSSPDNAIPYKGKKKALKKVSKGEDFVNEEDDGDFIHPEVLD